MATTTNHNEETTTMTTTTTTTPDKVYDRDGNVTRRTIRHDGWIITQAPTADGGWWNIEVRRATNDNDS